MAWLKCRDRRCKQFVSNGWYCPRHLDELEALIRKQGEDFAGRHFNRKTGRWVYEWSKNALDVHYALSARGGFKKPS